MENTTITRFCKFCNNHLLPKDNERIGQFNQRVFCSRSCAAKLNNQKFVKRTKLNRFCENCSQQIPNKTKRRFCEECCQRARIARFKVDLIENRTKGELFQSRSTWQSARTAIRVHAQRIFDRSKFPKICFLCGYSNHIEICHIKNVSDFSNDALIKEINDLSNLVALCPNHHWEFDNHLLSIKRSLP